MDRTYIIRKTMFKLGMPGKPSDPLDNNIKNDLVKDLWNERDPKKVIKEVQDVFFRERPSKEAKQDLFKFFKMKGLFKRNLNYPNMEKAWRFLLKEHDLHGFLLES